MMTYFQIDKWKTWDMIAQEQIEATKIGREWRIKTRSVWRYFEKRKYKGGTK